MAREITTDRLLLRPFRDSDAEEVFEYAKNPNVGPHAGWKPHTDICESKGIIEGLFIPNDAWAIIDRKTGRLIGSIGLEIDRRRPGIIARELGYSLAEEFWGRGLMTEAAKAVIEFGFREMELAVISICTSPSNSRSTRVIEKCGFQYEGTERYCYRIYDGSVRDSKCFSLLKSEWEATR